MEESSLNCTLARLSFWVPAARMAEFETIYETRIAPILKKHGLVESAERGRPTVEGVFSQALWPPGALQRHREGGQKTVEGIFSRLFAVESPAAVAEKEKALQEDPAWREALQELGATFGAAALDGSVRWRFWFYRALAGPGKQVPVGSGKGHWRTFDVTDGLVDIFIHSIFQDREGYLWFGSFSGVGHYDGQRFTTFTLGDSAADNTVRSITQDREGYLWFGTEGGVRRYDGQRFTTFTTKDGLANSVVTSILEDREGNLWFGTHGGGVGRYDGQQFKTFTAKDGLPHDQVSSICQDRGGMLWFGTWGGGASRYDGQQFKTFTAKDGLAHDEVKSILQDQEGHLWFGTMDGGVSCYDGQGFKSFSTRDDLAGNQVRVILQDRQGNLWFGTQEGGLSRYDGQHFTTFTTKDDLARDWVWTGLQGQEGHLWFGTLGGGVSRYDGQVFQTLTRQDGLASNTIVCTLQDRVGRFWFGTGNGVTRYCPPPLSPPSVFLDAVVADRRYEGIAALEIPVSVKLVAFEFRALSFKTRPEAMVYRYRLEGYEKEWKNTHARRVEYQDLPLGEYTFQVRAIDRDLNYSDPVEVYLTIVPDPRDARIDELEQRVRERTRELEEKNRALEQASRFKSDFLARMSHDLRTPMNAIIGYTRILLRKTKEALDERQYQNLQNIQLSADHLLGLINDILDLSRVEAGRIDLKPEPVQLRQLVQECAAAVASLLKPGVYLKQQVEALLPLRTDPDRLRRVLMNLLSNAVKFTEAGRITVSARWVEGAVELAVMDTGIGIPAEDLPHIFEEFRQSSRRGEGEKQGTGLGLAIAKKSVELLGGTISVESQVGKGTKFTLRIRDYEG